jgi:hypothetical protein
VRQITAIAGLVFATLAAPLTLAATGIEKQDNPEAITVLFVNGIRNDERETGLSSEALIVSLRSSGLPQSKYNFDYFYNSTEGGIDDTAEVVQQAKISDALLSTSNGNRNTYYKSLGSYYIEQYKNLGALPDVQKRVVSVTWQLKGSIESILSPRAGATPAGLVIVPHSQGNLYAEAAYAIILAEGNAALLSRIRVVGVASAAATTPSNRYITHTTDRVIANEYGITHQSNGLYLNYFSPLELNVTACLADFCGNNISNAAWAFIDPPFGAAHGFQNVYLNPQLASQTTGTTFPKIIYDLILASLRELGAHGAWPGTLHPSDTIEIDFSFDNAFISTPDVLVAGVWETDRNQPQDISVTVTLYDGTFRLGSATQSTNGAIAIAGTFSAPESIFSALGVADFTTIRSRTIAGRITITLNVGTIAVDPRVPGTVQVIAKNCSRIPCTDVGIATVSAVKLNDLLIVP